LYIIIFILVYFFHSYTYSFLFLVEALISLYVLYFWAFPKHFMGKRIFSIQQPVLLYHFQMLRAWKHKQFSKIYIFEVMWVLFHLWCMVSVSLNGFIYLLVEHVFSIFKPSNTIVFVICYLTVTSILTLHHLRWFGNMILKMAICLSALLILAYEIVVTCYCFCVSNVFS
jgi:hypothetical protein